MIERRDVTETKRTGNLEKNTETERKIETETNIGAKMR